MIGTALNQQITLKETATIVSQMEQQTQELLEAKKAAPVSTALSLLIKK